MKVINFWRDQEIRLGFLLGNEILEPALATTSLAPDEEKVFRNTISFIRGARA
jgi:hypothetical protein